MNRQNTIIAAALLAALAVACPRKSQAQETHHGESFELDGTLVSTRSYEYKANNYIWLKKGFYSNPQSPNYAMLEIDPYFNPAVQYGDTVWKPLDCCEAGRLGFYPMDFDVNDNGAAVISMPLEFPEGINGMTPHLSLNYNSQGGNGIMGVGWSLGGMSKISRVPYTYIYNDSCGSVQFSDADQLSLDGVALIKGTKDGKVCYYPEIYDYSIVYPINSNGTIGDGFRVMKKDGKIYTYTAKYYLQNSILTPIEWHLTRVEDPYGNYIQYGYKNDSADGAFYPDSILYTGNSDTEPAYKIKFRYYGGDERVDCPKKWFSKPGSNTKVGFSRISKKLTDIECWHGDSRIISYSLSYRNLDWRITALWMVNKHVFNSEGKSYPVNKLAPTEFQWAETDYQLQFEAEAEEVSADTSYDVDCNWYQYAAFSARFERYKASNDTVEKYETDIVHLMQNKLSSTPFYFLNVIKSDNHIGEIGQSYHYSQGLYDCYEINQAIKNGREIKGFAPADVDGDGLNEIVCASYMRSGPFGTDQMCIFLMKPDVSGVFHETFLANFSCQDPNLFESFTIADFNGDGLSDMFYVYDHSMCVRMSEVGVPFSISVNQTIAESWRRRIVIGDFDGSKKDQIVLLERRDMTEQSGFFYRVVPNSSGTGYSFTMRSILDDIPANYYTNFCCRLCVGDFNGDGKKDIMLLCNSTWRFYLSKGNGLFGEALVSTQYHDDDFAFTDETDILSPAYALVADLDDDGHEDLCVFKVKKLYDGSNDYYKHLYRRDFLIRTISHPDSVLVRRVGKYRYWWLNGLQDSTDICIDSIKCYGDINPVAYSKHNPFIPIMGIHKGTSPTEVLCCHLDSREGVPNLGIYLRNTGCLESPPVRAVNRIVTSLGATTEITYRPVSYQFDRNQEYGREGDGRDLTPVLPFRGYLNIVEKVRTEVNEEKVHDMLTKTWRTTRYHFSRPYYHTRGRGFLGFRKVWMRRQGRSFDTDPTHTDDILVTKDFTLNGTYHILVPFSVIKGHFDTGNNYSLKQCDRTDFTYLFNDTASFATELGQIPGGVFDPYLSSAISQHDNENTIHFEKETYAKDGYGNTTEYRHSFGVSLNSFPYYEKKTTQYEHRITASRWLTGIPQTEQLEQLLDDRANIPLVRRNTTYENDLDMGRHIQMTTEPGHEKQLTETYGYDGFGNLVSTSRTSGGVTRTESVAYSVDGRFPVTETNALGYTTHYYHDEATGRLDSVTDPNGLTTRYRYDILGNLVQTEYPSGVLEDQSLWWVGNSHQSYLHPDTPGFGYPLYFTCSKRSGESELYVFYDQHNRKMREVSRDMEDRKTYVDYRYDDITGMMKSVSAPYYPSLGETPQFTTYTYDYLDRTVRIERPDGGFLQNTYYSSKKKTVGFDGQTTILFFSPAGLVVRSCTNENNTATHLNFTYYGDGSIYKSETESDNNPMTRITYTYDVNRNPRTVTDPSLGSLTYDYNAFGELVHCITPRNETTYTYDALGRMKTRFDTDGNSYWTYDNGFVGTLSSTNYVPANGPKVKESYQYDNLGQLIRQTQKVGDGEEWVFNYTYNWFGKQSSVTYPSGKKFKYHYNSNGFMDRVKDDGSGSVIWQANASDRWGNIVDFIEGEIGVTYDYDPVTGLVNGIAATRNGQTILRQSCHWTAKGNLDWRTDATLNLKESFGYDALNRLTSAIGTDLEGNANHFSQSFDFDQKGNITAKTGLESYAYNSPTNPYAVTGVQPAVGQEGLFTDQTVTYTSFDKIDTVNQDGKALTVSYGIDRQRVQQAFSDGDNVRTKRYFTPLYECVTENGVTKNLHYLTSATGLFAIFVTQNNQGGAMHYTLKDHQGNLTATVCGNTVERLSYDAWGRRRDPNGFGYSNVTHTFDRGYTLHEHYDDFDLINMNGRCYDPVIGRMLSPDIAIQDEHDMQAYNRYSYCFNNPLRFTDPSGYVVDEWEIDAYGQIINHKKDKTQDVFYLVEKDEKGNYVRVKDENGNYKSIAFEYGTIEKQKTISLASGTYDTYEARGDENGKSLFEFFAEIVRDQGIEVSYAKTGIEGDKGLNFITTSQVTPMFHYDENGVLHKTASEPGMTHLLENKLLYGYTIRELNHSHPLSSKVSSADENFANQVKKDIQKKNGYHIPKFYIYVVSSKEYIPFGL